MKPSSLLRLLRLASPALPIGGYAYSQGLEWAVRQGDVHSEESLEAWLAGILRCALATLDLPLLARMHRAWARGDERAALALGRELLAWRDCAEARREERQMGGSLAGILLEEGLPGAAALLGEGCATYPGAFALACCAWSIPERDCLLGYAFAWAESQVTAAVKLVPLGQTAGQRVLTRLTAPLERAVLAALEHGEAPLHTATPGRGLAQLLHAGQDARLFRS